MMIRQMLHCNNSADIKIYFHRPGSQVRILIL
jgi:hypothetical protein